MLENWLTASRTWFELDSQNLRCEAEEKQWRAENEAFTLAATSYEWEFIDEWI
jgi:hypothetical protein